MGSDTYVPIFGRDSGSVRNGKLRDNRGLTLFYQTLFSYMWYIT